MQVLVLVVHADIGIAIAPKRVGFRRVAEVAACLNPAGGNRAQQINQRRVMALRPAWLQPLHRQGAILYDVAHKAIVAQFIGRLVEGVDHAIGERRQDEGDQNQRDAAIYAQAMPEAAGCRSGRQFLGLSTVVHGLVDAYSATASMSTSGSSTASAISTGGLSSPFACDNRPSRTTAIETMASPSSRFITCTPRE